jgi:tRNA U34 5-methylaminomethyl-2-thiouridine-forming methyltransferase MnmC
MDLVTTGDGSHTLYVPGMNEHYHSSFGAVTESEHVFIQAGLMPLAAQPRVAVFEVGFGTGLNALLTSMVALERKIHIVYHTLEKYPVGPEIASSLNYASILAPGAPELHERFMRIHQAPWDSITDIHPYFSLHKIKDDLVDFHPDFCYDLVYFDAFAPDKQPEMWSVDIFNRLFRNLNQGGILTTYCVKGIVKRMLKEAGFTLEKLPGPPGKREILRALKKTQSDG